MEGQQSDLTFDQLTLLERVMVQTIGAVGFILLVLKDQSLISSNEIVPLGVFGSLYVVQKILKPLHYGNRYLHTDSTDKKFEQGLYAVSIGLNILQYASTVLL